MRINPVCFPLCFLALVPSPSYAADADSAEDLPPALVARLKLANALYDQDNLAAALIEYKRVQKDSGKTPGLFNVARICARLNRPVEAVAEFDKLLSSPGRTPLERLEEARRLRDEQAARIGRLVFWTTVPAFVEIDNVAVGRTDVKVFIGAQTASDGSLTPDVRYATAQPIQLGNGVHLVAAIASGHAPLRQQIEIGGGATKEIDLALVPAKGELAHIKVKASVPSAEIHLDGNLVGRTPIDVSLPVVAGSHELALKRTGYYPATLQRELREGQSWDADIVLEEDPAQVSSEGGELVLDGQEPGTALAVNGKLRDLRGNTVHLPPGLHQLELSHSGFLPYHTQVDIEPGKVRRMRIEMEPTAEARHEHISKASGQRWRAWGAVAAGAVLTGGGALYLRSAFSNHDVAERNFDAAQTQFQPGGVCSPLGKRDEAACQATMDRVNSDISTADRKVLGGYIATGVGAAVLVTGLVLALTVDDVERFEKRGDFAWFGWARAGEGGIGLAGRY
jgi:hypothetical protein